MAGWADGWVARAGGPDAFAQAHPRVIAAWRAARRAGKPYTVALSACALGRNAREEAGRILGDYFGYTGARPEQIAATVLVNVDAIRDAVARFEAAGCDELPLAPALPYPGQVDLLAEAVEVMRKAGTIAYASSLGCGVELAQITALEVAELRPSAR